MNDGSDVTDEREAFASFLLRLRGKGIVARELVSAFEATPRHAFVPDRWRSVAWSEGMIPIECGEPIEGPDLQAAIIASLAIEPGDCFVLCSDGLSNVVEGDEMARILAAHFYRQVPGLLVGVANDRGGEDNITVVLIHAANDRAG